MGNQFFNISYDPIRDGFSKETWSLVYGDVTVTGGQLEIDKALIVNYGDIIRGDAIFSINIATPVKGDNSDFGFIQLNKNCYLSFSIVDGSLFANSSNGVDTNSVAIDWYSDWSDTDTEFRIKWEAGMATFSIGGQFKAVINDSTISGSPMSLYVRSDSSDPFLLDYIIVKSIQSYVISEGNSNSTFQTIVKESDKIRITDVVTAMTTDNPRINKNDTVNISEITAVVRP